MPAESPAPLLGVVPQRSPACQALIAQTAARIEPQVDQIAAQLIERVMLEMSLPDDDDLREDLRAAARGSVALITAMARNWTDPRVVPPPHDALVWARGLVARGLTIDALLRVYRIGQSGYHAAWHRELVAARASQDVTLEAVAAVAAFTFTWVDAISIPLVDAYEEERLRRVRSADAARAETVQAVLSGAPIDVQQTEARLGYRLRRPQLAILAWVEPDAPAGALDDLEGRLAAACERLAAPSTRPLVVRESPRAAIAWISPATDPATYAEDAAGTVAGSAVHLAVGDPGDGVEGFRATHDQARRARRVGRLLRPGAQVTTYRRAAVADLLTQDLDAARALARSTLGPLTADTNAARRLLSTLRVFVEEGQSFARAAPRLGVHENTVAYRVRRAVELAGPVDPRTLWAAVELAPLLDT